MARDECRWVDPRTHPKPPATPRPLAEDSAEVDGLVELCQTGRIYAVEDWIAEGRAIQAKEYHFRGRRFYGSPLTVAIETNQRDLLMLLLCNGYQVSQETDSPLERALYEKRWDLLELFLEWGADPSGVDADAVFATYRTDLFDRFWKAGVDFTRDDCLAKYLAKTTSNRPLYGWVKRHQDGPEIKRALALALVQAAWDGREKAVHLLLWAGADPHTRVPILEWHDPRTPDEDEELYSAVENAIGRGDGKLLRILRPDPERDDIDALWTRVQDPDAVDALMAIRPPGDWSQTILFNFYWITNEALSHREEEHRWCLERIAHHGGRLTSAEPNRLRDLRKNLLRMKQEGARRWLLHWLSDTRYCDPTIYAELVRTPAMRTLVTDFSGSRSQGRHGRP
jgi:hypothetical protein